MLNKNLKKRKSLFQELNFEIHHFCNWGL